MLHDLTYTPHQQTTLKPHHVMHLLICDILHFLTCRVVLRGFIKIYITKAPFKLNSQQQFVALLHVSELALPHHIPGIFIAFSGMSL